MRELTTIAAAQQPATTFAADDYFPMEQMQLMKIQRRSVELFGDVAGEVGHDATR